MQGVAGSNPAVPTKLKEARKGFPHRRCAVRSLNPAWERNPRAEDSEIVICSQETFAGQFRTNPARRSEMEAGRCDKFHRGLMVMERVLSRRLIRLWRKIPPFRRYQESLLTSRMVGSDFFALMPYASVSIEADGGNAHRFTLLFSCGHSFFRKLLDRIEILHNRFGLVLPEGEPMPRGIGIWLVYSRDAENRFALIFADGRSRFFLFFFHLYLSYSMTKLIVCDVRSQDYIFMQLVVQPFRNLIILQFLCISAPALLSSSRHIVS